MSRPKIFFLTLILGLNALHAGPIYATLKGNYYPRNMFTTDLKASYKNDRLAHKEEYELDGGYGLAFEAGGNIFQNERWEVLTGINYMHNRQILNRRTKETLNGISAYDEDSVNPGFWFDDDVRFVQITSFYLKTRWLFDVPAEKDSLVFYVGGKGVWNILKLRDETKVGSFGSYDYYEESVLRNFENSFGYGFSCGWLLNNQWDIELAYDIFNSNMTVAAFSDFNFKGSNTMSSLYLSVGYRWPYDPFNQ
ncbi:hypothetical protein NO1_1164 [Candidatus Termititenax aidoneus]|uniref:Outer membrane protein beta-barrel domain-containing protein n=1 Tax=Termititenax aidoneus TaxID=2218524 RepID=A0A388TBT8_TERA1|nr:hypothetical protein NO1_1164 [Candidatus Termititenax aidoneus]